MTDPRLFALVLAVGATLAYLIAVGLLLRLSAQRRSMPIFAGVAIAFVGICLGLFGRQIALWHFVAYFSAGVAGVVFLYGAVLKSLSLAMLSELAAVPEGQLPLSELAARIVEPSFAERARLLVAMDAATTEGGGFAVSSKGRALAGRLEAIRRMLRIETLGLYGASDTSESARNDRRVT